MKKLGIAFKSTLQGSGEAIKVNDGPWDSKIVDIRDVIRHTPSLLSDPNRSIIFLSFSETGAYITVARCFMNRDGDNIAGWIYVPRDIQISGDEVCRIVDEVRNIIFLSELPPASQLMETFGKEYPERKGIPPYIPSTHNGKFGRREILPSTPLDVLLGSYLYQPEYSRFQAVFIEQFKDEVTDATDLTGQPLVTIAPIVPPVQIPGPQAGMPMQPANIPDYPTWNVETGDGRFVKIAVKDHTVNPSRSPLRGYKQVNRTLVFQGGGGWKDRILGFCAALVLGGIVCGILALSGTFSGNHKETAEETPVNDSAGFPTAGDSAELGKSLAEAIAYLDSHDRWSKAEMEQYPDLQGLFDDLNNFNFAAITGAWKGKLSGSSRFVEMASHAEKCFNNGWPAKENKPGGTYNASGDEVIFVQGYNNWVDSNCLSAGEETHPATEHKTAPARPLEKTTSPKKAPAGTSVPRPSTPKTATSPNNHPTQKPQSNRTVDD